MRRASAGALAGAITNGILHPLDTVKTVRQADPKNFPGTFRAMSRVLQQSGWRGLYGGLGTAMVGAMPSSFVFFGTYEAMKARLTRLAGERSVEARAKIHMVSAACGNAASSLIFVPKELVKQRLQAARVAGVEASISSVVAGVVKDNGVRGLYAAYTATICRNIPTTVLNFLLYEELKVQLARYRVSDEGSPVKYRSMVAGACSGACASAIMTPIDVCKTRLSTGRFPASLGLRGSLARIAREEGIRGLYAGAQARILGAALFSAVGLSTYDYCKQLMGVGTSVDKIVREAADDALTQPVVREGWWRQRLEELRS